MDPGLSAEARQRGLDDRGNQEDEYKIFGGADCEIVVSGFGHGSSQKVRSRDGLVSKESIGLDYTLPADQDKSPEATLLRFH
jgi:hypothetical protein